MRILVVADIHANWTALSAIDETFDACLVIGDLVDYGTDPLPCVRWVRKHATAVVRGNHDHAVAQNVPARKGGGFRRLAAATRLQNRNALDPESVTWLARLPVTHHLELDGASFYLVHATPRDPMDEYLADETEWRNRLDAVEADFVCVGHTHVPLHLEHNGTQLLNPGSVGQPRDGDPRAAYAIVENGRVEFRRVEYNIEGELAKVEQSGVTGEAFRIAETVLRTGTLVKPAPGSG